MLLGANIIDARFASKVRSPRPFATEPKAGRKAEGKETKGRLIRPAMVSTPGGEKLVSLSYPGPRASPQSNMPFPSRVSDSLSTCPDTAMLA